MRPAVDQKIKMQFCCKRIQRGQPFSAGAGRFPIIRRHRKQVQNRAARHGERALPRQTRQRHEQAGDVLRGHVARQHIVPGAKLPAGVQQALFSFGVMAMQRLINSYGSAFMAGFNGANKLDTFAFMPIQSFATAATTFVGQNIGANRPERVHKGTVATLWMSCGFSVLVAALLLPTGRFCMRLFSTEPAVIESGFAYLARILPFYWMLAIMFVLSSIMRGAGEMMVPMISSLAALWLARVPAAYLLAHFFGPMNIHFCYAIGWALGLAICVPYYFSGRWKEKSIVVRAAGGS